MYRVVEPRGFDVTVTADLSAFKDADQLSEFARAAMERAVPFGLINGVDGGLSDSAETPREQIARILMRVHELTKDVI